MAGITQTIPTYVHGMSEQPDELKLPGQVRDALNVLPDVTKGLLKRPGARLINPLATTKEGSWFSIYRTEADQYIGRVSHDGVVSIWSCVDGMPRPVTYQDTPFSLYPKAPDQGATDSSNRPSYAGCDIAGLTAAIDALRLATKKAADKRKEIDDVQTQIEIIEDTVSNPLSYVEYELKSGFYEVKTGFVDYYRGYPNNSFKLELNKPMAATSQVVVKSTKPVLKKVNLRILPDYSGGMGIAIGDVYAWVLKDKSSANDQTSALKTRLSQLEAELSPLEVAETAAQKAYEAKAGPCGIFSTPYSVSRSAPLATPQSPAYLQHDADEQLQFLTINDYTFITNRNVTATMSGTKPAGPVEYKAFISIDQVAPNKVYGVNLYKTDAATPVNTSKAVKLSIAGHTTMNTKGGCPDIGTQEFTVTNGAKTNLRFELKVMGSPEQKNPSDPYSEWRCKYHTKSVELINGGDGWVKGDIVEVTMKGVTYKIKVEEDSHSTTLADIAAVRPAATPNSNAADIDFILGGLKTSIEAVPFFFATIIGNGILVHSLRPFNIAPTDASLMSIMTDDVTDISKLPSQCKDGYIVRVANSGENEDDYYLQFHTRFPGVDGEGVWEEVAKPGIDIAINGATMPHQVVFNPNTNSFIVSPVDWEPRLVGDDKTNPKPSFVGKKINKMLFFRNRLVMLSDENVIMSRPGDYWNFWAKTAMTINPADAIDISASSTYPAILYDGIEVNSGLLLFSANQQFLLTTDNDVLGPETVKINSIASYQYNYVTQPVSMGTTVGFLNNAGRNARLFEINNIRREGEVEVLEQSKLISEKLPANMDQLADSRENNLLMCGTKGSRDIWGYRYFNSGTERIQSAWFRWELTGDLVYHTIMKDVYYAVLVNKSDSSGNIIVSLQRFDLKNTDWTAIVEDSQSYPYTVHMDNYRVVLPNELQWYPHLNQTYFRLPMGYFSDKRFAAYTLKRGKYQGRAAYPKIEIDSLGTWAVFEGNWSDTRLMIGYEFEMDVELPTIYYQKLESGKTRSDLRGSLIIHRVKFDFGPVGVYDTTIERKGRADYNHLYESREQDGYDADAVAFVSKQQTTVPCYERNTNLTVHIRSSHPSPATVYSMTWEGDYNKMYYERV